MDDKQKEMFANLMKALQDGADFANNMANVGNALITSAMEGMTPEKKAEFEAKIKGTNFEKAQSDLNDAMAKLRSKLGG